MSDDEVAKKLLKFQGSKDLEDCTELGKLLKDDEDEDKAKNMKMDWQIIQTTFKYIGGIGLIITFSSIHFLS